MCGDFAEGNVLRARRLPRGHLQGRRHVSFRPVFTVYFWPVFTVYFIVIVVSSKFGHAMYILLSSHCTKTFSYSLFFPIYSLSSEVLTLDLSKYADNTDLNNNNNTSRTVEGMEIQVGGGGAYSPAPSSIAHSNTGTLLRFVYCCLLNEDTIIAFNITPYWHLPFV